jgi:hypothetical protein
MITAVVVTDSAVDVASSSSSHAAIIAALELLLECCAQLCHSLLLLLELPFKLSKLFQLGLCSPQRWWHGCACSVRGVGRGTFALIFVGGSFIGVETLMKVVVSAWGLAPSPRVIKLREISVSLGAIVFLGVDT